MVVLWYFPVMKVENTNSNIDGFANNNKTLSKLRFQTNCSFVLTTLTSPLHRSLCNPSLTELHSHFPSRKNSKAIVGYGHERRSTPRLKISCSSMNCLFACLFISPPVSNKHRNTLNDYDSSFGFSSSSSSSFIAAALSSSSRCFRIRIFSSFGLLRTPFPPLLRRIVQQNQHERHVILAVSLQTHVQQSAARLLRRLVALLRLNPRFFAYQQLIHHRNQFIGPENVPNPVARED